VTARPGFWIALAVFAAAVALLLAWMTAMPGRSFAGPFDTLSADERDLAARLRVHVVAIASRERNLEHPEAYEAAATYLEGALAEPGHGVRRQPFEVGGRPARNLEVEIAGSGLSAGVIVIGAHYDSVRGSPGANDNGSGVAATVELARLLADWRPRHAWRFVLFANEEPPWFHTESMGSAVYARAARQRGEHIVAMFSLETLGYYSDAPGSQHYPFPLNLVYPDRGDFVAFVGNLAGGGLVRETLAAFREHASFPSDGVAAPGWLPGIDWSDHWSFWREGWPALMITDTAPYRYPHYHTRRDTPDKVDYDRLARVVKGLEATFRALDARLGRQ
jgi:Zn-dependent M28 family amino/carboxypeptidase